jgi:hypothetical protein
VVRVWVSQVVFSGPLAAKLEDVVRIKGRTVILHNCTLMMRPGQR